MITALRMLFRNFIVKTLKILLFLSSSSPDVEVTCAGSRKDQMCVPSANLRITIANHKSQVKIHSTKICPRRHNPTFLLPKLLLLLKILTHTLSLSNSYLSIYKYSGKRECIGRRSYRYAIVLTSVSDSAYTSSFSTSLNRRGKRGGVSKSNREANTDNGISIIAMQLGCARINC